MRKYFKQFKPCDGINATEYLGDVCNGLSNCTAAFNEGKIFTNAPDVCKPKTREYATYEWWCVPEIFRPCVISEGSYECICPREYIQNQTTKECDDDVDECSLKTHECHPDATCENIWGSFTCEDISTTTPETTTTQTTETTQTTTTTETTITTETTVTTATTETTLTTETTSTTTTTPTNETISISETTSTTVTT